MWNGVNKKYDEEQDWGPLQKVNWMEEDEG